MFLGNFCKQYDNKENNSNCYLSSFMLKNLRKKTNPLRQMNLVNHWKMGDEIMLKLRGRGKEHNFINSFSLINFFQFLRFEWRLSLNNAWILIYCNLKGLQNFNSLLYLKSLCCLKNLNDLLEGLNYCIITVFIAFVIMYSN